MAAIDSLLGIVDLKKADGIVLATDEVPALLVAGGRSPLTMPPLSAPMVEGALDELLTPELRAELGAAGQVETSHASGSRGTFHVRVRVADGKTTVTLEKGDGGRAAAAGSAPPGAAPAPGAGGPPHRRPACRRPGVPSARARAARGRPRSRPRPAGLRRAAVDRATTARARGGGVDRGRGPGRHGRGSRARVRVGAGRGAPAHAGAVRERRSGVRAPGSAHRRGRALPGEPLPPVHRLGGGAAPAVGDPAPPARPPPPRRPPTPPV